MGNEWKMMMGMSPPAALFQLMVFFALMFLACEARFFTNHWAVRITGGREHADEIAEKYGFRNMGQVCNLNSVYVFSGGVKKKHNFASCDFKHWSWASVGFALTFTCTALGTRLYPELKNMSLCWNTYSRPEHSRWLTQTCCGFIVRTICWCVQKSALLTVVWLICTVMISILAKSDVPGLLWSI